MANKKASRETCFFFNEILKNGCFGFEITSHAVPKLWALVIRQASRYER